MTAPISNALPAPAATRPDQKPPAKKPAQATAAPPAAKTTVTLSQAGLAALAASKEANESPAQTAREASGNDMQAKRLLAKESAEKAARG